MYQIGILTISDRASVGQYDDQSGPLIANILTQNTPWTIQKQQIVPDEFEQIVQTLTDWSDNGIHLILTSGGTGFAPRDITPEATRTVLQRETPGIAEALRAESLKITRHAMLSRAVAGIRNQTLIINMPGNPKAVRENLAVLLPILPHALELVTGLSGSETSHRSV